jgi:DNA polymerase-3 subunit epsilon
METTGVDPNRARIVSASIVTAARNFAVTRSWLIDPGIEIPADAIAVHGITTEVARTQGQPAKAAIAEIRSLAKAIWAEGLPMVVYNAPYDLTVLDRELRRHGLPGLEG